VSDVLYVAAKAPRVGLAKTRLARSIGEEWAVLLYCAFLRDLGAALADAPFEVAWYVTPPEAWGELAPLVDPLRRRPRVLAQGEGDWTSRQRALFRGAADRGEERFMVMASDSPQITAGVVAEAFELLNRHDIVLGPVLDGGYYLLGMRGWHDVLSGVAMSTGTVADEIVARAEALGLTVGVLEPTFDVDGGDDLIHLETYLARNGGLSATRTAMARVPIPV